MTAHLDLLLERLQQVRKSGPASWRAACPCGHKRPNGEISITEAEDGRVLLHAFCGHAVAEVLGAMGLALADLYPERIKDLTPEGRRRAREAFKQSAWACALRVLAREVTVVLVAAGMLRHGQALNDDDQARLATALQRIDDARTVLA